MAGYQSGDTCQITVDTTDVFTIGEKNNTWVVVVGGARVVGIANNVY
jgi:hypothetical protein